MDALDIASPRLTAATAAPRTGGLGRERALAVARDFEAVYVADAFKLMMQDVSSDPVTGSSSGDNWRELLVDEYAKEIVRRGGLGLAGPIADSLMKIQETANP
jgi:Rod binding domain-containing protein